MDPKEIFELLIKADEKDDALAAYEHARMAYRKIVAESDVE